MSKKEITTAEEAAAAIMGSLVNEFSDYKDEQIIPVRELMAYVAKLMGIRDADAEVSDLPEYMTVGDFRQRTRQAQEELLA